MSRTYRDTRRARACGIRRARLVRACVRLVRRAPAALDRAMRAAVEHSNAERASGRGSLNRW